MGLLSLLPAISAGGQAAATIVTNRANIKHQERTNQQNLEHNRVMYERQRSDALADRDYADKYNSPEQQMQRLKDAGLNPNLVYGSGATNTPSATVKSSSAPAGSAVAPKVATVPFGNAIMDGLNASLLTAQIDQTRQVTKNLEVDNILKQLDTFGKKYDNTIKSSDADYIERMNYQKLWKLNAERLSAESDADFKDKTQADRISTVGQQLANMQADGRLKDEMLKNLENKSALQQLDYYLRRHGLDSNDPLYIKAAIKFLTTGVLEDAINVVEKTSK